MPSSHLILCHPLLLPPIPLSIRVFSSLQFTRKCFVSLLLTFSCFNSLLTKYQEPQQKNSSNCTYTAVRHKGVMPLKVNHYLRVGSNVQSAAGKKTPGKAAQYNQHHTGLGRLMLFSWSVLSDSFATPRSLPRLLSP